MQAWIRKNTLGGVRIRSQLDAHEAKVLRSVVSSVVVILDEREQNTPHDELEELTGMKSGNSKAPDNAVLARLLPEFCRPDQDPHTQDPGAKQSDEDLDSLNSALRSLNEPSIIDDKRSAASVLLDSLPSDGGKISLTPEQADGWICAINDARLALGTVLEVDDEMSEEFDPDDPKAPQLGVYHWLTWMQDALVGALMGQR
ncbi:DUF2017 domain-containing protein [Hoyosella rhizosphaerae]|uniref:DUF2017 domain-containing protein n=1 Tax=Hoyosella rhizosphaerae TaxID=1755582 RepID=A0A916XFS8_9ACTN|nr:DUF2017 domain-containing protein [Hoyosella rhizosphaerae]MBN4925859.1 DUF2017 domain-containing protein [Hoyosella rhizosphaerae]GGC67394.1 hypothetical protein GCM10011410_20100 [Hoyosella rhizosphaerae]